LKNLQMGRTVVSGVGRVCGKPARDKHLIFSLMDNQESFEREAH